MKQVFSIILSLIVLITSMGFTVSSHKCGSITVDTVVSVVKADVSCGMERKESNCDSKPKMKKKCCQDNYQLIQGDQDYTQQVNDDDFSTDFLTAFVITYIELRQTKKTEEDFFIDHSPPPLIKDIPVFNQSFLI